jgi:hypothetical protein
MPTTQLDVANFALSHLAIGKPLATMDDARQEARVMTQFYDQARDEALRAFDWYFATKFATLVQVAGPSPRASVDWAYSYTYPADCVRARIIRNQPRRPDVKAARVPFRTAHQGSARVILTDAEPIAAAGDFPAFPELEYTVAVDEAFWPVDFVAAVSQLLAFHASPLLTAGDPHKLGARAFDQYDLMIRRAWQSDMNEREEDIGDPECEFLSARA